MGTRCMARRACVSGAPGGLAYRREVGLVEATRRACIVPGYAPLDGVADQDALDEEPDDEVDLRQDLGIGASRAQRRR